MPAGLSSRLCSPSSTGEGTPPLLEPQGPPTGPCSQLGHSCPPSSRGPSCSPLLHTLADSSFCSWFDWENAAFQALLPKGPVGECPQLLAGLKALSVESQSRLGQRDLKSSSSPTPCPGQGAEALSNLTLNLSEAFGIHSAVIPECLCCSEGQRTFQPHMHLSGVRPGLCHSSTGHRSQALPAASVGPGAAGMSYSQPWQLLPEGNKPIRLRDVVWQHLWCVWERPEVLLSPESSPLPFSWPAQSPALSFCWQPPDTTSC